MSPIRRHHTKIATLGRDPSGWAASRSAQAWQKRNSQWAFDDFPDGFSSRFNHPTRTSLYDRPPTESRGPAVSLGNKPVLSYAEGGRDDVRQGQRIFHGKFGYGTIAAIEGNKLEIDFEHAGRKRVLDSFVSLG